MHYDDSAELPRCGKKRKKRSFLQAQKRFAKKGSFGRGTQLSQDVYDYFINIIKVINAKKDDEDEMRVLSSNILQEIKNKESEYCCNQIISRAVETLLPYSCDDEFSSFIDKFGENLRPLFSDTYGSHILQQSIMVSYMKYEKCLKSPETEDKLHLKFFNYIMKLSNFLMNNFDEFIWNVYSNAVARTVFNVLSGNPVKGEVKEISFTIKEEGDNAKKPEVFVDMLKKFKEKVLSNSQFDILCNDQINSGLLQSLVLALHRINDSSEIIEKVIDRLEKNTLDLMNANSTPFIRLLEVILTVSNKSFVKRIYKLGIKEILVELAQSKHGNFLVQKVLGNCNSKKLFGKIFAKLECEMEKVLEAGNSGVLLAIVKCCHNLQICQGQCMTMLSRVFHMKGPEDIVPTIAFMTTSDDLDLEKAVFTIHGCLIIQELLNFQKPRNVVSSLLSLSDSNLVRLLCDTKGCHITDAFVASPYVGEKNKDKLFKKLQGHYMNLASSKYGSRSLDAIWSVTSLSQKTLLAEELKSNQSDLCANTYGKNFAWKIHLDNFRRNKEEWINAYRMSETAEKYFADILPVKRQKKS